MFMQGRLKSGPRQTAHRIMITVLRAAMLISTIAAINAHAVVERPDEKSGQQYLLPALGISPTFGRWVDTVYLRYNPAGAHPDLLDSHHMIELIREAANRWEQVSGIRFDIRLDAGLPAREGEVPVTWAHAPGESWAGRAGPHIGSYDNDRGYYSYSSGTVRLNSAAEQISDTQLLRTLTHELGHLIGLGHSENPNSMMFANPYNSLQFPMEDDIRAVQVLYGSPDTLPDMSYTLPPAAPVEKAQRILDLDSVALVMDQPANDMVISDAVSLINDESTDSDLLRIRIPFHSTDEGIKLKLDVVRPDGVLHHTQPFHQTCASWRCTHFPRLGSTLSFKVQPGTWRIYITEDKEFVETPELLYSTSIEVDSYYQYNRAPKARLAVKPGNTPNSINVQVIADDPEGDNVTVLWHLPGPRVDRDGDRVLDNHLTEQLGRKTQSTWQPISFPGPGTHELFIQVNDDAIRYGDSVISGSSSGSGFQTLLKLSVTLPLSSEASIQVMSSYVPDGERRWLSTLNGIQPTSPYKLPFQRIGLIGDYERRLYSCVQVTSNGILDPAVGGDLDVTFVITSLETGVIRLEASRSANPVPGANLSHARCSGRFETTTGLYTDVIRLGDQLFDVEFSLMGDESLTFQLTGAEEVIAEGN